MEQIQLEATNEQTAPARLRELAQINPTIADWVAANPNASPELLTELANSEEDFIRKNVAANPNTPMEMLWWLGEEFPEEVLDNAVFPLLLLENPNLLEEIPYETLIKFLTVSKVPISFMEWAVKYDRRHELGLCLGKNSQTPRTVLEKLARSEELFVAEVAELHVNYAGKVEEDWQKEFRRQITRSATLIYYRASYWRNTGYRHFLPALVAIDFVPKFFIELLASHEHKDIRSLVASLAPLPLSLLEKLGRDPDFLVRRAIAKNPIAPPHLLEMLAKDETWVVRATVAENPNTPASVLEQLAKNERKHVRWKVATNTNTPASVLEELARDEEIFLAVAGNPNTPTRALERLALYKLKRHRDLKKILAANPNTPIDLLEELERDPKQAVRDRVASNPSAPKELLEKFACSNRDGMREALASNPKVPEHLIDQLAGDKNPLIRRAIAANPLTPLRVLEKLWRDRDPSVQTAVAVNPKLPFSFIEERCLELLKNGNTDPKILLHYLKGKPERLPALLELIVNESCDLSRTIALWHPQMPPEVLAENGRSLNWLERCAIAQNPNTPIETLQLLAADGNRIVRAAAKETINN